MTAARKLEPRDAAAVAVAELKPYNNSKREVAEFLGHGIDFVNGLMQRRELGYFKTGTARQATVRISREHVAAYLRSCER